MSSDRPRAGRQDIEPEPTKLRWTGRQGTTGRRSNESGQDCLHAAPCRMTMQDLDKAMGLKDGQAEERLGWYGSGCAG
ncbi:hypothetical protein IAQ61_005108 [Plenodomus lingam]|uniref:uncharacterized protein n=1 Tax=Leptosphaeria maculans TaxID=5022 RepID=UPI003332B65D|nr:hypothetical protein IAQ61_005108 [Plenodomus lingam]